MNHKPNLLYVFGPFLDSKTPDFPNAASSTSSSDDDLSVLWDTLIRKLYPMTELSDVIDKNYEKFQKTADFFTEYRKYKTWQDFRSDSTPGYHGISTAADALDILRRSVF